MAYDNEMRGVLFRNDKKQPNDSRPNAKGRCQIDGVVYWVAAWTETKRDSDEKYQQLRFERAEAKYQPSGGGAPAPTATEAAPTAEDFGMASGTNPDEIPF